MRDGNRGRRAEKRPRNSEGAPRRRMTERAAELFGIPADAVGLSDGFMAELRGRCSVSVTGCRRILAYSEARVALLTREGPVEIVGEGLTCTAYACGTVGIGGRIDGVCFADAAVIGGGRDGGL